MSDPLHLIDLDQRLPGQRRFISCWAHLGDVTYIIDPGPPSTGKHLVAELEALGLDRLDFILLTHIHLDHAGTTAGVLARWPEAKVVCHDIGRPHLADPTRLWEGSRAVLREMAEAYGQPSPVPETALVDFAEARAAGIETFLTPGHAAHHVSFLHGRTLFVGEAAGTFSDLGRGPDTPDYYLRPATPPRFKLEVATASLERLLAIEPVPERLCFAHHGQFTGDVRSLLTRTRDQHIDWVATCRDVVAARGIDLTAGELSEAEILELMAAIAAELRERDPYYARIEALPPDIREREHRFTQQTLWGMLGYLQAREKTA